MMNFLKKTWSVVLSLVLCATLFIPSFAATFTQLQEAVDGDVPGTQIEGSDRYGYAWNEEAKQYGIEAWDEEGTRNVLLKEDVIFDEETDGKDHDDIRITDRKDVVLDLNGKRVDNTDHNPGNNTNDESSVLYVIDGSLTLNDSSEDGAGKITGATHSGVWVGDGKQGTKKICSFVMNGGTITGNTNIDLGPEAGGGGVRVAGVNSSFTMNGGKITGNTASANGGGVTVVNGGRFEMTGGEISGNQCDWGGGVAVIGKDSTFTMSGGAVLKDNKTLSDESVNHASDVFAKKGGTVITKDAAETESGNRFDGFEMTEVKKDEKIEDGNPWKDENPAEGELTSEGNGHLLTSRYVEVSGGTEEPGGGLGTVTIEDPDTPLGGEPEVEAPEIEIDDPAVPLASGPVTRAQFIDYLWRHEDGPETDGVCTFTDVPEDHEYVLALAWAEQNEVAFPYEDSAFKPDELVTVGAVREFLDNFAKVFGTNAVAAADLKSLTGAADEAVLNCGQVLAEFFGEEYAAPQLPEQDELGGAA